MIEMSATEAREFGIPVDQRQRYYRLDPVDAPRPPANKATWFRSLKVNLGDGTANYYSDRVETDVVERWYPLSP